MQAVDIKEIAKKSSKTGKLYIEFMRLSSLSVGLYSLPAGGSDPQQPHTEDEIYYVVSGSAVIRVGEEDQPVQGGSVVLVEAGIEHRFHTIEKDLIIVVFFAPAEYSLARQ